VSKYVRCPGCHLRMETAPALQADQKGLAWKTKHEESGTAFVNWPSPESDPRAFPCSRCTTPIQRGLLVKGLYNETIPHPLVVEVPVVTVVIAYLIGWIFGWGIVAGIIAGAIAFWASTRIFFDLHHGLVENHKLVERGLPRIDLGLDGAAKLVGGLLVLGIATGLYQSMGWLAVVTAAVVVIAVLATINRIIEKRRHRAKHAFISEHNQQQMNRVSHRKTGEK